jgi:hypothetical protein
MQQMQSTAAVLRTWVGSLPPAARDQIERDWDEEDAGEEVALAECENEPADAEGGLTADDIPW